MMMPARAIKLILGILLAVTTTTVKAIYPDDHWSYSKQLTEANFESTIQSEIDAGKTMFVRWIASPGWGWWRKQAPAWNAVVKAFAANDNVSFGDVNLSEAPIRGNHNPGAGGWPTIRYFNKETGVKGGTYVKKTAKSMCEELGNDEMMTAYVEEYANTSSCSIVDGTGCDSRELVFLDEMKAISSTDLASKLARLESMEGASMKPELLKWIVKRKKILKQLLALEVKDEL
jgi:hypothetical protein